MKQKTVGLYKAVLDVLPPCMLYGKYLSIASIRFNLTMDECRNKYGKFTINQWENLFNNQ